jgi:hypothetical protein
LAQARAKRTSSPLILAEAAKSIERKARRRQNEAAARLAIPSRARHNWPGETYFSPGHLFDFET